MVTKTVTNVLVLRKVHWKKHWVRETTQKNPHIQVISIEKTDLKATQEEKIAVLGESTH